MASYRSRAPVRSHGRLSHRPRPHSGSQGHSDRRGPPRAHGSYGTHSRTQDSWPAATPSTKWTQPHPDPAFYTPTTQSTFGLVRATRTRPGLASTLIAQHPVITAIAARLALFAISALRGRGSLHGSSSTTTRQVTASHARGAPHHHRRRDDAIDAIIITMYILSSTTSSRTCTPGSNWVTNDQFLDSNNDRGFPLPRRVVDTALTCRLGIADMPIHQVPVVALAPNSMQAWIVRLLAAGRPLVLEIFRSAGSSTGLLHHEDSTQRRRSV